MKTDSFQKKNIRKLIVCNENEAKEQGNNSNALN